MIEMGRVHLHLRNLISIPSISSHGTIDAANYVSEILASNGHSVTMLPADNGRDANVIGNNCENNAGLVLSAHLDVVPVERCLWTGDPFVLREDQSAFFGRGATDMKGFVALALALAEVRDLPPITWAFSWGEEIGCLGVKDLLPELMTRRPWGCIVGEPTELQPIIAHKGRIALKAKIVGRSVHSSRPDLGMNANHHLARIIAAIDKKNDEFQLKGPFDAEFAPAYTTIQANVISGGNAGNIVAGEAEATIDVRFLPEMTSAEVMRIFEVIIEENGINGEVRIDTLTPAFRGQANSKIARLVSTITGGQLRTAPFTTEAGLFEEAGVPTVVCGPGSVKQAHISDEYITREELRRGAHFLGSLIRQLNDGPLAGHDAH